MVVYNKNFIEQVIFHINYEQISLQNFFSFTETLPKTLEYEWRREERHEDNFQIGTDWSMKRSTQLSFVYSAILDKVSIEIANDYFSIIYNGREYTNKSIFDNALEVLRHFIERFNIQTYSRVSLRYINNIIQKQIEDSLETMINKSLLSGSEFSKQLGDLSRSMGQSLINKPDCDIMIKYGYWNRDFPAKIIDRDFILDIECISQLPLDASQNKIKDLFLKYNKEIDDIFEQSITEKMRKYLNS